MVVVLGITTLDELVQYKTNQGCVIKVSYEVILLNDDKMHLLRDYQINLEMLMLTEPVEYERVWENVYYAIQRC